MNEPQRRPPKYQGASPLLICFHRLATGYGSFALAVSMAASQTPIRVAKSRADSSGFILLSAFQRSFWTRTSPTNWTVQEAEQIVRNFLPSDADEVETLIEDETLIMVEAFSPTLEQEVSEAAYDYGDNTPTYGGYSYALRLTSAGDVSWMVIQLRIEDEFLPVND